MASAGVRRVYSELCGAGGHVCVGGTLQELFASLFKALSNIVFQIVDNEAKVLHC